MNTIDRYTIMLFWGYFIGGLLVFVTIFTAVDAMSTMVNFDGVSPTILAQYYSYGSADIIMKMLPVACLLGTILTLSNLNKSNELVALFASGMSLLRVTVPILLSVAFICLVGFYAGDRVIPRMNQQKSYIYYHFIKKNPAQFSMVRTDKIWYRSKNAIFNLQTLSKKGDRAQGLTLYFFSDEWNLLQMLTAKQVEIMGNNWNLAEGSITLFTDKSSFPLTSTFKKKSIIMGEDIQDLQSSGQTSDMLSQQELKHFIKKNKEAGLDTLSYEVDYHNKFSFAVAGLILSFLGIPFSVSRGRSGGAMLNIGLCMVLVLIYYVLTSSATTLGQHGALSPLIVAWGPNLLMAVFADRMLKRTNY